MKSSAKITIVYINFSKDAKWKNMLDLVRDPSVIIKLLLRCLIDTVRSVLIDIAFFTLWDLSERRVVFKLTGFQSTDVLFVWSKWYQNKSATVAPVALKEDLERYRFEAKPNIKTYNNVINPKLNNTFSGVDK